MNKIKYTTAALFTLSLSNFALAQHKLETIQVFGGNTQNSLFESIVPFSIKDSSTIQNEGRTSVGDAVSNLPGVNSTGFNPTSTRPIIRGLEGERIRILIDQLGTLDVSGTSADHVVPINPLLVDSIEVVRGPISLLYGSSAVGGVVNIVSSRTHDEPFKGTSGSISSQYQTVNNLKNISAKLDYGLKNWIFHFDGNYTHNQNLKVPTPEEKVTNSQGEQSSINIGGTYFYEPKGHLHFSYTNYNNKYGVVAEEDVFIDAKQDRFDFMTKNHLTGPVLDSISTKTAFALYEHSELEGDEVGTTFEKTGVENRIELTQKKRSGHEGITGLHTKYTDLEVAGDEAFLPSNEELNTALFSYQEFESTENLKFSLGNRFELSNISPEGLEGKNYFLINASVGTAYKFNKQNSLSLNASYNERNPNTQELFSNGAHIAIGIFEQGDSELDKEKAYGVDLSYKYKTLNTKWNINLFANRFTDYINLANTQTVDDTDESGTAGDSDEDFQIFNYIATDALFYGAEFSLEQKVSSTLNVNFQSDVLVGKDLNNDVYLPRLTPPRLSLKLNHIYKRFSSYAEVVHALEPLNLSLNETNTDAYTVFNLGTSTRINLDNQNLRVYAQARNLFNAEARNHSSFTKDIMQLGSANFILGVEATF